MAEIRQKIVSCPQGHYYDANKYQSCPYCNSGSFSPTIDPFSDAQSGRGSGQTQEPGQGSFTPTIDPMGVPKGGNDSFIPTMDPHAPAGGHNERMSVTQFVDTSSASPTAPVTGWLIALSGALKGTDFRIHTGYNYIGRERGDIIIRGDSTISAEKDANITYVPQTRRFYIAHELGKNVLLVNNLPVIGGTTELKDYDIITVGMTKLLFRSLCCDAFSWEDEGIRNA